MKKIQLIVCAPTDYSLNWCAWVKSFIPQRALTPQAVYLTFEPSEAGEFNEDQLSEMESFIKEHKAIIK